MIWNYTTCVRHSGYVLVRKRLLTVTNGGESASFFRTTRELDPFICPHTVLNFKTERDLIRDLQTVCLPVLCEFQRATKWTKDGQKEQLWSQIMWMCYSTSMWMRQYSLVKWFYLIFFNSQNCRRHSLCWLDFEKSRSLCMFDGWRNSLRIITISVWLLIHSWHLSSQRSS